MNKKRLAALIHEYNLACKEKEPCKLCWTIAGQVLLQFSMELREEFLKKMKEENKGVS